MFSNNVTNNTLNCVCCQFNAALFRCDTCDGNDFEIDEDNSNAIFCGQCAVAIHKQKINKDHDVIYLENEKKKAKEFHRCSKEAAYFCSKCPEDAQYYCTDCNTNFVKHKHQSELFDNVNKVMLLDQIMEVMKRMTNDSKDEKQTNAKYKIIQIEAIPKVSKSLKEAKQNCIQTKLDSLLEHISQHQTC